MAAQRKIANPSFRSSDTCVNAYYNYCSPKNGLTLHNARAQIGSFGKGTEETAVVDVSFQLEVEQVPADVREKRESRCKCRGNTICILGNKVHIVFT